MCLRGGKGLIRRHRTGRRAAGSGRIRIVGKVRVRKTCSCANFVRILKGLGASAVSLMGFYLPAD